MSTARARETFHHGGGTIIGGTELDAADPIVEAFAPMFDVTLDEPAPVVPDPVTSEPVQPETPEAVAPARRGRPTKATAAQAGEPS